MYTAKLEYNMNLVNLRLLRQISYINLWKIAAYNEHGYNKLMAITKLF